MGITIVQKSDLNRPKDDPKIAIVLAGGAVSGGAYKVGGLHALDSCLENRKVTDFDTFVGLSAGSIVASLLANGIAPAKRNMTQISRVDIALTFPKNSGSAYVTRLSSRLVSIKRHTVRVCLRAERPSV